MNEATIFTGHIERGITTLSITPLEMELLIIEQTTGLFEVERQIVECGGIAGPSQVLEWQRAVERVRCTIRKIVWNYTSQNSD